MKIAAFTIASKNYLPHVRVLFSSLKSQHPEISRHLVLCDRVEGYYKPEAEDFQTHLAEDMSIPRFSHMAFQYTILEFNTAIKPFVAQKLFADEKVDLVIYFDPDIAFYHRFDELLQAAQHSSIVLVPHLLAPLPDDGYRPSEVAILQAGTYNLGFVALSRGEESDRMLSWWSRHCANECVVDVPNGLFVDQKWMDLVPGLAERCTILRHPGYNVAYWNLPNRPISRAADGTFQVCGEPLVFFHYSGFNPLEPTVISKHTNRFPSHPLSKDTSFLFDEYAASLLEAGYRETRNWPYAFGRFRGGPAIPNCCRSYFLKHPLPSCDEELDPFDPASGDPSVYAQFQSTIPNTPLTVCAMALYEAAPEIQKAFPNVPEQYAHEYARWFVESANSHYAIPRNYLEPVEKALGLTLVESQNVAEPRVNTITGLYNFLQGLSLKNIMPLSIRKPLGDALLRLGSGDKAIKRSQPENDPVYDGERGVNLIGYIDQPIGVGEAARGTLRALAAAEVPVDGASLNNLNSWEKRFQINLWHVNADTLDAFRNFGLAIRAFQGRFNIGFWMWELQRFPPRWDQVFSELNEIWAPSSFVQQSIAERSRIPVVCMPLAVDRCLPGSDPRDSLGLPNNRPIVLCMFDAASSLGRKNPFAALRAFRAVKQRTDEALLVIKVNRSEFDTSGVTALREELNGLEAVIIDRTLTRAETWALLASCDALLSLHRSEGFGLILAEAMSLGKPVIATGYSGNMEFMTATNSFPVDYRLVPLDQDIGPYPKGYEWAEPNIDHAASLLELVLASPSRAALIGQRAAEDIATQLTAAVIGQRMRRRLTSLGFSFPSAIVPTTSNDNAS